METEILLDLREKLDLYMAEISYDSFHGDIMRIDMRNRINTRQFSGIMIDVDHDELIVYGVYDYHKRNIIGRISLTIVNYHIPIGDYLPAAQAWVWGQSDLVRAQRRAIDKWGYD